MKCRKQVGYRYLQADIITIVVLHRNCYTIMALQNKIGTSTIATAHRKLMFSEASVSQSVHEGEGELASQHASQVT